MKTAIRSLVAAIITAFGLSTTAHAVIITSATTAIEANLAAGTADGGNPNSSAWFYSTNVFSSYGALSAADWNSGDSNFSFKAGSIMQWNLTGFTNPGDTMGTVNSASFTIMGKDAGGVIYNVYRLVGAIDGSTTWNTKPLLDTSTSVSFTMAANYALQTIDVSSLLANNGTSTTFGLTVLTEGAGAENFWSTGYDAGAASFPTDQTQNKLSAEYSVVPEPATGALLIGGLGLLAIARRRLHA